MFKYTFNTNERRLLHEVGSFGATPETQHVGPQQPEGPTSAPKSAEVTDQANSTAGKTITEAQKKMATQAEMVANADPNAIREAAGLLKPTVEEATDDADAGSAESEVSVTEAEEAEEGVEG